jgi:hypothetical protein
MDTVMFPAFIIDCTVRSVYNGRVDRPAVTKIGKLWPAEQSAQRVTASMSTAFVSEGNFKTMKRSLISVCILLIFTAGGTSGTVAILQQSPGIVFTPELNAYLDKSNPIAHSAQEAEIAYLDLHDAITSGKVKTSGEEWVKTVLALSSQFMSVAERIEALNNETPTLAAGHHKRWLLVAAEYRQVSALFRKCMPQMDPGAFNEIKRCCIRSSDSITEAETLIRKVIDPDGKLSPPKKTMARPNSKTSVPASKTGTQNSTAKSPFSPELAAYTDKIFASEEELDKAGQLYKKMLHQVSADSNIMATEQWRNDAVTVAGFYNAFSNRLQAIKPVPPKTAKTDPLLKRMIEGFRVCAANMTQMATELEAQHQEASDLVKAFSHVRKSVELMEKLMSLHSQLMSEIKAVLTLDKAQRAHAHK